MRPLRPAPVRAEAMPRLHAGWRLLAGAAPLVLQLSAHADSTVPPQGDSNQDKKAHSVEVPVQKVVPCPSTADHTMRTGGVMVAPQPPRLDKAKKDGAKKSEPGKKPAPPAHKDNAPTTAERWEVRGLELHATRIERPLVIHPHGPDEPCEKADA
jgi:hypothetical protein